MCPLRVFLILFSAIIALASLLWTLAKDQEERERTLKNGKSAKQIMIEFCTGRYLWEQIKMWRTQLSSSLACSSSSSSMLSCAVTNSVFGNTVSSVSLPPKDANSSSYGSFVDDHMRGNDGNGNGNGNCTMATYGNGTIKGDNIMVPNESK